MAADSQRQDGVGFWTVVAAVAAAASARFAFQAVDISRQTAEAAVENNKLAVRSLDFAADRAAAASERAKETVRQFGRALAEAETCI